MYKIFKYLVYEKEIIKKEESIIKEIKMQFNDRIMKILFENSIDILILLVQQLQYNDQTYSNDFNKNYVQKLYAYCERNIFYDDKIKLIRFIFGILEIIDRYSFDRIEILLGYPTIIIKTNKDSLEPLFGVNLMNNNNLDQEIFEYTNFNHIRKQRCILALLFPNSDDNKENILKENDRLDFIYELMKIGLGLNEKKEGNYFLFKYIYLMQPRKIIYENLYTEMKQLLENANKINNNKYDLSIFKSNEKKCITLINFEYDETYNLINIVCHIDKENQNYKKYVSKPFLPDCFDTCTKYLDENLNKDYLGLISDIIPHKIVKIKINQIASSDSLSILRLEYYTTYFTRKELINLSEDKSDFIYENVKRNQDYENEKNDQNDDEEERALLKDFSIFKEKKSEKDLFFEIDELLTENGEVILVNEDLKNEKDMKNCLIRYYILAKKKNSVIKIKEQKMDMSKDIENNYYMPEFTYNCVLKEDINNAINIHRLRNKFKFLGMNDIGINIIVVKYDKYFNEFINY